MIEVPEREVAHGPEEYSGFEGAPQLGNVSTLEMTQAEKAKARRRERIPFGFGGASADTDQ